MLATDYSIKTMHPHNKSAHLSWCRDIAIPQEGIGESHESGVWSTWSRNERNGFRFRASMEWVKPTWGSHQKGEI